jgi:hypothetical protein
MRVIIAITNPLQREHTSPPISFSLTWLTV